MPRDLSTRLFKAGRFSIVFEPRDCWIGVFWGPEAVYVVLVPCIAFRWARVPARVTFTFPHGSQVTVDRRGNVVDKET